MLYTVKEVSELSNVTIKTLHHYHKIGLLHPSKVSEAGYRLYGTQELERLQEILFYRELDFSLNRIKELFANHTDRHSILSEQQQLIADRQRRLDTIALTLQKSITSIQEGTTLDNKEMFKGFNNEEEWNQALTEQNQHLTDTCEMAPLQVDADNVPQMNEQAVEAMTFMNEMSGSLKEGVKHNDAVIINRIEQHLAFLNSHGHATSAQDFAAQTQFFLQDDFHLSMLEGQQIGLAYYLSAAAGAYAALKR